MSEKFEKSGDVVHADDINQVCHPFFSPLTSFPAAATPLSRSLSPSLPSPSPEWQVTRLSQASRWPREGAPAGLGAASDYPKPFVCGMVNWFEEREARP